MYLLVHFFFFKKHHFSIINYIIIHVVIILKTKLFDEENEVDLEEDINNFISDDIKVCDIKYNVALAVLGEEQIYCFSAMILYEEK